MDQLEQLLDMIEHPDRYTEQQVNSLLSDPDLRKHYEVMVSLRMAYENSTPTLSKREGNQHGGWYRRVAAIFIGVLIIGGIALAAWMAAPKASHPDTEATTIVQKSNVSPSGDEGGALSFDNISLDSLLTTVAKHYGHAVVFANDSLRQLRITTVWNDQEPLATFLESMNELDGLLFLVKGDTIYVEPKHEEGAE
jgi:ferric-dicitrate binding protein FerR (iron transport regulator)